MATGLRNRSAFEAAFRAERQRFERYGRPLAVLLVDVDHFKTINDTHGHETGDAVLRTMARVLESAVRDVDVPAASAARSSWCCCRRRSLPPPQKSPNGCARPCGAHRSARAASHSRYGSRGVAACPEQVSAPQDLLGSADGALRGETRRAQPGASGAAGARPVNH
jgi:predicted signal transduction protein with EAL and GGDEF domain